MTVCVLWPIDYTGDEVESSSTTSACPVSEQRSAVKSPSPIWQRANTNNNNIRLSTRRASELPIASSSSSGFASRTVEFDGRGQQTRSDRLNKMRSVLDENRGCYAHL